MTTQNRYYSNLSQVSYVTNTGGLSSGDVVSNMTTQASVNWPTVYPFTVRFEPGTNNEEVGLVTSGLGTAANPFVTTRGYDGTNVRYHASGTAVVPGFCELDFAEPQQHLNAGVPVSGPGPHGLPSSAWSGGTMQLLDTILYSSAVGTTISIPSIPTSNFNHLRIEYSLQGNGTSASSAFPSANYADLLALRFNSIAAANYQSLYTYSYSTGLPSVVRSSNSTQGIIVGAVWIQDPATAGRGRGVIEIPAYADNGYKTATHQSIASDGGSDILITSGGGSLGSNTSAISSIQLQVYGSSTAFTAGAVWLYGIN